MTKTTNKPIPNKTVQFIQYHKPALEDGIYTFTFQQSASAKGNTIFNNTVKKKIYVAGERFSLSPEAFHAVFPPANSSGEHSHVLPHIVLNRSTLPWERDPNKNRRSSYPWLALLVFYEGEIGNTGVINLKETDPTKHSLETVFKIKPEPGQHDTDQAMLLEVDPEVLKKQIPEGKNDLDTLALLTHVRKYIDHKSHDQEKAVVIGRRLPKVDGTTIVHLVSMESRYNDDGTFDYTLTTTNAAGKQIIPFVSLKSWRFNCTDDIPYELTETVLSKKLKPFLDNHLYSYLDEQRKNLESKTEGEDPLIVGTNEFLAAIAPKDTKLKATFEEKREIILAATKYPATSLKGLLLNLSTGTLKLPENSNSNVNKMLNRGAVPLQHTLRQGGKTVSWYQGPFTTNPKPLSSVPSLPVDSADSLYIYDEGTGLLDVSYAAAWQLGRALALEDQHFALSLFDWKRTCFRTQKNNYQLNAIPHLLSLLASNASTTQTPPDSVINWLYGLSLLKGVPFDYLVPDTTTLQKESIKFFCIDSYWIACLLTGACSLGWQTATKDLSYSEIADAMPFFNTQAPQQLSGVVIHSDAVAGWPDLQVNGYTDNYTPKNSKDTLLTFDDTIDILSKDTTNPNKPSEALKAKFKSDINIKLSDYSFLKAANTANIWQLVDPQKPVQYRLQKEGDKFEVYQDNLLRRELLSSNIMLCIFQENINQVNIHLRSEALHFGFEEPDYITHNDYYKALRDKNTGSVLTDKEVAITWQGEQADNVLDIQKLATDINKALENKATPLTADIFALEMILGAEGVSFKIIQ